MTTAEERAAIVAEARSWLRTPYHEHARIKGVGVDCAQLLIGVYCDALGIREPEAQAYAIDWFLHSAEEKYLDGIAPYAIRLPEGAEPEPGDLALFRFGRAVAHAGIITEFPEMVHAERRTGRVELDSLAPGQPYRERLAGYFTLVRWLAIP